MCRQRNKVAASLQVLRPRRIAWRQPATAARGSTGIRAARRRWRPIAGSASRTAASRSISRRGTCGASKAHRAARTGSLRADAADRCCAWRSRQAERKRSRSARLAARSERRPGRSGCTLALPGRGRTDVRLSRSVMHARGRAGHDHPRAGGLRFTTVLCSIPAVSHRCGSATVRAALTLPAARSSRSFLTWIP
jgi:hypothetical protein